MPLERAEVEKIAHLARLAIDPAQIPFYASNLSKILALVADVDQAQTEDIPPMAHPAGLTQRMREDIVTENNQVALFQSIAPEVEAGLYLVPKVIEAE